MLIYGVSLCSEVTLGVDDVKGSELGLIIIGGIIFFCFLRFSAERGGNSKRWDVSEMYLQMGMISVREVSGKPKSFCVEMLGVETVAFEYFQSLCLG